MKWRIFADRVKLYDSYLVQKSGFQEELARIRLDRPSCRLWERSEGSLRREWAAHNLAYSLGIKRDKTKDCDLNYEQKWYVKLMYGVVGTIALLIIK